MSFLPRMAPLITLATLGCVVHTAPPAEPAPPAPRPAPVTQPRPAPPLPVACSTDAPALYTEVVRPARGNSGPIERFTVLTSGAWTLDAAHGPDRGGCLDRTELAAFERALDAADFTAPPPPRIQCKAMPTRAVTYVDVRNGRKASSSAPCGRQANDDVYELSAMARRFAMPPSPPTPPTPPTACAPVGAPIYDLRIGPIVRDQRALMPPATERVTIYASGYWRRDIAGRKTTGCLAGGERQQVARAIAAARLQPMSSPVRCLAMPNRQLTLILRKGSYRWTSPCGADSPDRSVHELMVAVKSAIDARP